MKTTRVDAIRCHDDGPPTVPPGTKVVATELIIEGGPMRHRRPTPLDAAQVERIVRDAVRAELAVRNGDSRYWSPERAARECGVSQRTFADWMASGKIQFFKPCRRVPIDPTVLPRISPSSVATECRSGGFGLWKRGHEEQIVLGPPTVFRPTATETLTDDEK